jgi:hypothetical protein
MQQEYATVQVLTADSCVVGAAAGADSDSEVAPQPAKKLKASDSKAAAAPGGAASSSSSPTAGAKKGAKRTRDDVSDAGKDQKAASSASSSSSAAAADSDDDFGPARPDESKAPLAPAPFYHAPRTCSFFPAI